MNPSPDSPRRHSNLALWITVIIEGLMIIAVGAYNIYEIRRNSELVQDKIQGLSEFSARQGEKIDRMLTAIELYVGKKLAADEGGTPNEMDGDRRIDRAIELLKARKSKDTKTQQDGPANR